MCELQEAQNEIGWDQMGCDDGQKDIDRMEGNPRTILPWSLTALSNSTLDEHSDPEALVSHIGPIGP
jgi:hypothetical protein